MIPNDFISPVFLSILSTWSATAAVEASFISSNSFWNASNLSPKRDLNKSSISFSATDAFTESEAADLLMFSVSIVKNTDPSAFSYFSVNDENEYSFFVPFILLVISSLYSYTSSLLIAWSKKTKVFRPIIDWLFISLKFWSRQGLNALLRPNGCLVIFRLTGFTLTILGSIGELIILISILLFFWFAIT